MPCYYDNSYEIAQEQKRQREALDTATRLLCEVTFILAETQIDSIPGFRAWVTEHEKMDRARKQREVAEKKAAHQLKAKQKAAEAAKEQREYQRLKKKFGG